MSRETYQQSLTDLRDDVLAMGGLVAGRLDMGVESLANCDENLARTVVEGDGDVIEPYLALENQRIDLFALQQPVAGDLRLVTASFGVITDLERVGDLATSLARYALAADCGLAPKVALDRIGREAVALLEESLDAYATSNADRDREIAARDDEIDAPCHRVNETVARDLIEREADNDDPWAIERLLDDVSRVLLAVRDLERVDDHAVNIAARTLYVDENDPTLLY